MMGYPPTGRAPNEAAVVGITGHRANGDAKAYRQDIWLTPAQAVYFLVTGEDLTDVARLSEAIVLVRLARIISAFVPVSTEAGPEEHAAAIKAAKEQLRLAGESPAVTATKWRDQLLATGLTAAEGRRTPAAAYETIKPVEFCDLTLAGTHVENARGEIVFYGIRISGCDLWTVRRTVAADVAQAELKPARDDAHEAVPPVSGRKKNGETIRRRGAYRGALDLWMARQDVAILQKMDPAGIAQEFKAHCEQELPELISLLPKRLRSMEPEIERIIERRRARNFRLRSANKGQ